MVVTICAVGLTMTARAVGGWKELREEQLSDRLPVRYLVPILPSVMAATLLIDPTNDLDGWEWLGGVGLVIACARALGRRHADEP